MTSRNVPRIGIVGAGVAGLAVGLALVRRGYAVTILEREAITQRAGAGIVLWSNAVRALGSLGLEQALQRAGTPIEHSVVQDSRGQVLARVPVGAMSHAAGAPTLLLARPRLIELLEAPLPPDTVRTGAALRAYSVAGASVTAQLSDGTSLELDALIGADGLHSTVRKQLAGAARPEGPLLDAWVGTSLQPSSLLPAGLGSTTLGTGPRFWAAAHGSGQVFWWATRPCGGSAVANTRDLIDAYAGWPPPIAELIASTPWESVIRTRITYHAPCQVWGAGPVTLLGDAVHPSTPDLGQGACQAIESALTLANSLASADSIEAGLRRYEAARKRRTTAVSQLASLASVHSSLQSPLLCSVRDQIVRLGFASLARSQLQWLMAGGDTP